MRTVYYIALLLFFSGIPTYAQNKILIDSKPSSIFIEQSDTKQILNFDFLISNQSTDTLTLQRIKVLVFDNQNHLIHTRFLDNNGTAPSILLVPTRNWNGKESHLVFNPFSEFDNSFTLAKLEFEWIFSDPKENETVVKTSVIPKKYQQKTTYKLPLKGRILVYDAHDYNSHHRRFDYNFEPVRLLDLKSNFMRYAYDFVILDSNNNQFKNKGENNSDYFGFGNSVYAAADGKILYATGDHKDDKNFDIPKLKENPLELYGNCIAMEHKDGSVSIYGHLKENSLKYKKGDWVKSGQEIAQIGVSGSSFFPHLHFEIRTDITNAAEGLPSYFSNINLLIGKTAQKVKSGLAETGNIIETK
ncbi:M23 family metallopeptidase [Flavobacterium sp. CLA17]|uniref:M23 family metallopeptidase n=1 Tax=Flavobacterium sp. CLA17 TaxID=2724135 RepID=UPI001493013A|nr:M23 family metallopeptidase [Flavobacterium sp. CLA17]QSB29108.1 M23 family metallopeptidase [Flavobacterium sp. CLA17]